MKMKQNIKINMINFKEAKYNVKSTMYKSIKLSNKII